MILLLLYELSSWSSEYGVCSHFFQSLGLFKGLGMKHELLYLKTFIFQILIFEEEFYWSSSKQQFSAILDAFSSLLAAIGVWVWYYVLFYETNYVVPQPVPASWWLSPSGHCYIDGTKWGNFHLTFGNDQGILCFCLKWLLWSSQVHVPICTVISILLVPIYTVCLILTFIGA